MRMNSSGKGAAGLTAILGVTALVLTVGFLFWLYQRSSSLEEEVQPVMEETPTDEPAIGASELAADPEGAVGSRVVVEEVDIAARLGRGVIAVRLSESATYPVLLSSDLIQRNIQLYGGDVVSVWGRVYVLNDSIRGAWVDAGAVDREREGAIPASASFLLADSLVLR